MSEKPTIGLELYSNLRVQFDLLQVENGKLRDALRKIAQHDGCSGKVMDTAWENRREGRSKHEVIEL